jgi:hypothetical protein
VTSPATAGFVQPELLLYTPHQTEAREAPDAQLSLSLPRALTCPSLPSHAKCNEKLGSDLFGISDLHVARVAEGSNTRGLEIELRAYTILNSIAKNSFRTLNAELVMPAPPKFDAPHLLIERYTPLSEYDGEITSESVWDLAVLIDRMHRSGVAHGHILESTVGVVVDSSPWYAFWRTNARQHLALGSPARLVVSPLSPFAEKAKNENEQRAIEFLREALKDDPRGLRVRIAYSEQKNSDPLDDYVTDIIEQKNSDPLYDYIPEFIKAHNAAVEKMNSDLMELLHIDSGMLKSTLEDPRDSASDAESRAWASLHTRSTGTVMLGKIPPSSGKTRDRYMKQMDELSKDRGLERAVLLEIDEIRALLRSPRESHTGLSNRILNVANRARHVREAKRTKKEEKPVIVVRKNEEKPVIVVTKKEPIGNGIHGRVYVHEVFPDKVVKIFGKEKDALAEVHSYGILNKIKASDPTFLSLNAELVHGKGTENPPDMIIDRYHKPLSAYVVHTTTKERIKNTEDELKKMKIKEAAAAEIFRQVDGVKDETFLDLLRQFTILHRHGISHGDAHDRNIGLLKKDGKSAFVIADPTWLRVSPLSVLFVDPNAPLAHLAPLAPVLSALRRATKQGSEWASGRTGHRYTLDRTIDDLHTDDAIRDFLRESNIDETPANVDQARGLVAEHNRRVEKMRGDHHESDRERLKRSMSGIQSIKTRAEWTSFFA